MNILDSVFKRYRPSEEKLLEYGFTKEGDIYNYSFELNNGDFVVDLKVVGDNVLSKIIDKEFGDEFIAIDVESYEGAFIGDLREEYRSKLEEIREKCFFKVPFAFNQSNRLVEYIYKTYNEKPDFPFSDDDETGVIRYHKNRKWYGIIMNINKSLLTKKKESGKVDVINVKINPEDREELLKIDGLYICYHMNKQKWISIILDETVPDSIIFDLVSKSRDLIINNKK